MSEERKGGDLVQLGALWKNEKDGNTYLSGTFGSANVFVFKNKWKKEDRDPDYKIFVGRRLRKKPENTDGDSGTAESSGSGSEPAPF